MYGSLTPSSNKKLKKTNDIMKLIGIIDITRKVIINIKKLTFDTKNQDFSCDINAIIPNSRKQLFSVYEVGYVNVKKAVVANIVTKAKISKTLFRITLFHIFFIKPSFVK